MLIKKLTNYILNSKPLYRKLVLLFADIFLIHISFHSSSILLGDDFIGNFKLNINYIILLTIIAPPIYKYTGHYKSLARYFSSYSIYRMIFRNIFLILSSSLVSQLLNINFPSFKELVLISFLLNVYSIFLRIVLFDLLGNIINQKNTSDIKRIGIYGAGETGVQFLNLLKNSRDYKLKFFVDDNPHLFGRFINKYPIYNSKSIRKLKNNIDLLFLASPNITKENLNRILKIMQENNIPVTKIPSIDQIANGLVRIESIRPIPIEDFLGREPVSPNLELLRDAIEGFNICIVGVGGSIGSELARQVFNLKPSKIILIERNEPSLYKINYELCKYKNENIEIESILGSAGDYKLISKIFNEKNVDIVFHAAAYKHVPLVEINPLQGISNNVLSTNQICRACANSNVKKMILISTDKAVRPTNIMGASKRLSELLVQAYANISLSNTDNRNYKTNQNTIFSIVRFGNVLNSSGSVLPLFRKQIESGGPITLTHELVERYFMTIAEAAQLVLQASALSQGGEVFLLDMGESKRIKELAEKMIISSGLKIKTDKYKDGDIEIKTIGLRPGEKLYEELLIDGMSNKTSHPLIYIANEKFIKPEALFKEIKNLEIALNLMDEKKVFSIISNLIPEWDNTNHQN